MRLIAVLAISVPLLAQTVSFGFRAGIPLTSTLVSSGPQQTSGPRYRIGPAIEVVLRPSVAVSGDFLLDRSKLAVAAAASEVWRWEAPVTVIYGFRGAGRPFFRAGVSLDHVFKISGAIPCGQGRFGEQFYCLHGNPLLELRHRSTEGLVLEAAFASNSTM